MQSLGPYGFNDPSQQPKNPYMNYDPRIQIVPQGQTLIYGQAPATGGDKYHNPQRPDNNLNPQSTNASMQQNSRFPTATKSIDTIHKNFIRLL